LILISIAAFALFRDARGQNDTSGAEGLIAEVRSLRKALTENVLKMNALVPPGTIAAFGGNDAPPGWLLCDGSALSSKDEKYRSLFLAIKMNWGNGSKNGQHAKTVAVSNVTDFNVPDLRGYFLRGIDTSGESRDPDRDTRTAKLAGGNSQENVGSYQMDEFKAHTHALKLYQVERDSGTNDNNQPVPFPTNPYNRPSYESEPKGGHETRPINAAVNYIIKY